MIEKLSKNFWVSETRVSDRFPELAERIVITTPLLLSAKLLAIQCLQPIRDKFGIVDILSWIRSDKLNKAVGGSESSDHLLGCAADIVPRNFNPEVVFKHVVENNMVEYRQIIYYPDQHFIHISCNHPEKSFKREAFLYVNSGKYVSYNNYYK